MNIQTKIYIGAYLLLLYIYLFCFPISIVIINNKNNNIERGSKQSQVSNYMLRLKAIEKSYLFSVWRTIC